MLPPGRTISMAPSMPPTTNTQRSGDTCSCMTKRANSVTAKGVNMPMAVNSATGMRCKLTKASKLQATSSKPRRICKPMWPVLKIAKPRLGSIMALVAMA